MGAVVEVEGLGKRYLLGRGGFYHYRTIRETLADAIRRTDGRESDRFLWALKDVDLTVDQGEIVGIIGPNGAGKSTLLKVLARITRPTTGLTRTRGRVGALLDVGTGFHPELTGRENIFLNGAVLGMSGGHIRRRMDEIVEFAGVEKFLDTPLKRYSTGMYLRLAFAIAAHLEPEIVVVDEVLAVGDVTFQRKSLAKMSEFTQEGRTVLFVSHDLGAINSLCSRAIWLDGGRIRSAGATGETVDRYLRSIASPTHETQFEPEPGRPVQLRSVAIVDEHGRTKERIRRNETVSLRLAFDVETRIPALDIAVYVVTRQGARVLDEAWSDIDRPATAGEPGAYDVALKIPPVLAPGSYVVGVWIGLTFAGAGDTFVHRDVLTFEVEQLPTDPADWLDRDRILNPTGVQWRVTTDRPAELGHAHDPTKP